MANSCSDLGKRVDGGQMPRITTWKLPLALWLLGLVAKIGLSVLVDDALGTWIGGALGFVGLLTFILWASQREARSGG